MAMHIPEEQIDQVRTAANIVDVVAAQVPLTRKGQNHWGLCPFHDEKSASFTVHEQKQIYHCFGCGEGGNVFSFVMKMEGMDFPSTVRQLADKFGIVLSVEEGRKAIQNRDEKARVKAVNEASLRFYRDALTADSGVRVRTYLTGRGLEADALSGFEVGWAPEAWDGLTSRLRREGVSQADAILAGVCVPRKGSGVYDRFRGRVMFPIRGADGEVVGFGGRVLEGEGPKYMNSPETPLYNKSVVLYGLSQARKGKGRLERVVVVEGYLDVIACHSHGIDWAVAPLGTALTESHARLLNRYTERVDLVFDGDAAGQAAARKAAYVLAPYAMDVRVVTLPAGEDPDSLLQKEGVERVTQRLAAGQTMMDFLFKACLGPVSGASIERRIAAAEPILDVLERIPDALRKGHYLGRLSETLGVDEGDLRRQFVRRKGQQPPRGGDRPKPAVKASLPHGEDLLLHLLVRGVIDATWLSDRVAASAFTDPRSQRIAQVVATCVANGQGMDGLVAALQAEPGVVGLITGWLNREVTVEGDPMACAEACVAALMKVESRALERQLMDGIKEAEQRGQTERLMMLLKQKDALAKSKREMMAG